MRERSSRVCRESMPSFLKKSSSGDSAPGASLKCCSARVRTSRIVFSRVAMTMSNLAWQKLQRKLCSRKTAMQTRNSRTSLAEFARHFAARNATPIDFVSRNGRASWLVGHGAGVFQELFQGGQNGGAGEEFAEDGDFLAEFFAGNGLDEFFR